MWHSCQNNFFGDCIPFTSTCLVLWDDNWWNTKVISLWCHSNIAFDIILDSSPSKALDKSIYIAKGSSLFSVLWRILSTSSTVASPVECFALKLYWLSENKLFCVKYLYNWLYTTFSNIFEIEGQKWNWTIIVCFRFVIFLKQRDHFRNFQFVGIDAGVQSLINDRPQWTY